MWLPRSGQQLPVCPYRAREESALNGSTRCIVVAAFLALSIQCPHLTRYIANLPNTLGGRLDVSAETVRDPLAESGPQSR
jgi:hypothetical protein